MKTVISRIKSTALNTPRQIKKDLADVKQFASDGCTGVPDFIFTFCCVLHDQAYSQPRGASRLKSDNELFFCMKNKLRWSGKNTGWMWCLPYVYWLGVRLFGRGRYQRKTHGHFG